MDFFNSFFQNVKDKLTSPFFGTLGFILLIHHWEFWYVLFNFSSKTDLHMKISILKTIGAREFHWHNLWIDIGWAVFIMIGGYLIIIATRSLSLFIDFGIMPSITKRVINKNVVTRTEFEETLKERDHYAEKYEEERKYGRSLSKSYDEQTEEIKKKNNDVSQYNDQITKLNHKIEMLNFSLSEADKKKIELLNNLNDNRNLLKSSDDEFAKLSSSEKHLQSEVSKIYTLFFDSENDMYWRSLDVFPPSIENTVIEIKSAGLWEGFKDVVRYSRKGGSIGLKIYEDLKPFGVLTEQNFENLNIIGRIIAANMERFEQ